MKIHHVEQGSAEWFHLRLGIPTASNFHNIITPKTGQFSKSSRKYAYRLIAEKLLNAPTDSIEGQQWMDRGKELEPHAVKQYEFLNDVETEKVGFITNDACTIGASPDRLVKGKPVGVEIKCPAPHTHIGYLLDGQADEYRPQVQGQLYVGEFERVDFYSYHPRMPACPLTTTRDEPYIKLIVAALEAFNDQMAEMLARAQSLGIFQAYDETLTVDGEEFRRRQEGFRDMDAALREA